MTIEETRQLAIEFERRVQTLIPEAEILEKLDSDTIFSFLNQYQDKYVHEIYKNLDQINSGSNISARVESVLQSLLREEQINVDANGVIRSTSSTTGRSITYPLKQQFCLYVRSVSKVESTLSFKSSPKENTTKILPNKLVSQSDVWKLIETPHNDLRILRRPIAVLNKYKASNPTLTVIYDQYTTPLGITVLYYAQPVYFNILTNTACELPISVFDDIVTGAVDLYVDYAVGAEANKRKRQEELRRQQNNRKNDNED